MALSHGHHSAASRTALAHADASLTALAHALDDDVEGCDAWHARGHRPSTSYVLWFVGTNNISLHPLSIMNIWHIGLDDPILVVLDSFVVAESSGVVAWLPESLVLLGGDAEDPLNS